MKIRKIVFALLMTLLWTGGTRAGDLNVVGNLFVASNLTAHALVAGDLSANLLAVNRLTLSGETRTNWPGNDAGSAVELALVRRISRHLRGQGRLECRLLRRSLGDPPGGDG